MSKLGPLIPTPLRRKAADLDHRRHRQYTSYLALCQLIPEFCDKPLELHGDELISYYNQVGGRIITL